MSYNNNHEYFYFDGLENNNPVSYRGVKKPLQAKDMYSDLVIINWAYEDIYNGLASRETNDAQNKFEDVLDTIENDDLGIIAVVIFGDGRKDWFCYVANFEKFMVEFNEKFKNHPKYPITIESRLDDNWNFHSGFIKWASDR
jgi:isocitrate dehydrogenase